MREFHLNVPLLDEEYEKFLKIKSTLEAEREVAPSDYDAIAMLVINMTLLNSALASLHLDGAIIYSTSKYGTVPKSNPAGEIFAKANVAIKAYFDALLMSPKAKAQLNKALVEKEVEEDDPLTAALKARAARGA